MFLIYSGTPKLRKVYFQSIVEPEMILSCRNVISGVIPWSIGSVIDNLFVMIIAINDNSTLSRLFGW